MSRRLNSVTTMAFAHSGKQRRLARLFRHDDGRAVILPIDDALISGPRGHLSALDPFFHHIGSCLPDAILLFAGVLNRYSPHLHNVAAIVNLTASTTSTSHTHKFFCTDVEDAVAAGADLVAVHVNLTSRHEPDMLRTLSTVIRRAEVLGVPVLAIMYPRRERNGRDDNYHELRETAPDRYVELVVHAARVAMELGADVIKTQYTGSRESFAQVVRAVHPIPVVTAGGPLCSTEHALAAARDTIAAGARGVSFGRNIFQRDDPAGMLRLLHSAVHEEASAASSSPSPDCGPAVPCRTSPED